LRGERQLRPLLTERGQSLMWFRHPYLRAGQTPEERALVEAFLHEHGYRVAPVTIDNGEWVWALAYENVIARGDSGSSTEPGTEVASSATDAELSHLRREYIAYMLDKVRYYENQSRELLGYRLPQIWLLHANSLNADAYADLIDAVRKLGYRTITLEEAMRDPAYAREDGYRGRYGPSWLHRWAMAEGRPREFYAGEPEVPAWVLELAGVDSE
jgi:hypothetical protein